MVVTRQWQDISLSLSGCLVLAMASSRAAVSTAYITANIHLGSTHAEPKTSHSLSLSVTRTVPKNAACVTDMYGGPSSYRGACHTPKLIPTCCMSMCAGESGRTRQHSLAGSLSPESWVSQRDPRKLYVYLTFRPFLTLEIACLLRRFHSHLRGTQRLIDKERCYRE